MARKHDDQVARLGELLILLETLSVDILDTHAVGESTPKSEKQEKLFKAKMSKIDNFFERFVFNFSEAQYLAKTLGLNVEMSILDNLSSKTRTAYYECLTIDVCASSSVVREPDIQKSRVKLPTINIPTFNGNISEWISFKDTFTSLIHQNQTLEGIEKFHYLKSALNGPALQAISSISLHNANYEQAWTTLCKRFDDLRVQANHHLMVLLNFKTSQKPSLDSINYFSENFLESAISFRNLQLVDPAGFILFTIGLRCLDSKTRERFEMEHSTKPNLPTFEDFANFIDRQRRQIQSETLTAGPEMTPHFQSGSSHGFKSQRQILIASSTDQLDINRCPICRERHRIYDCAKFSAQTSHERLNVIQEHRLCYNCLVPGHAVRSCPSTRTCRHCNNRHHTLIHIRNGGRTSPSLPPQSTNNIRDNSGKAEIPITHPKSVESDVAHSKPSTSDANICFSSSGPDVTVLLGTARAKIRGANGQYHQARILLDCASQRSCITTALCHKLGLRRTSNPQILKGFQENIITGGDYQTRCILTPNDSSQPELETNAVIFNKITNKMPLSPLPAKLKENYSRLALADPDFWKPADIDFLLGADLIPRVFTGENIINEFGYPSAIGTIFGYVLMGSYIPTGYTDHAVTMLTTTQPTTTLDSLVSKFWTVESVPVPPMEELYSHAEKECEQHFLATHSREKNGRYVVRLPFKISQAPDLRDSEGMALKRFMNLERRLNKNPPIQQEYSKIIQEYLDLNYISLASAPGKYFLPHHCVVKDHAASTKVRIVFDGSATAKKGSLNQFLRIGPKLQLDIRCVLLDFRKFPIAFAADITQMYLQIKIHPDDRCYQHFFYRSEGRESIKEYEINRVTFGLTCSPFLAIRVLHQLTKDEGASFENGARVLLENTYVDDILAGAKTLDEAIKLKTELVNLLEKGCFTLKKWSSNSKILLKNVPETGAEKIQIAHTDNPSVNILGLQWDTATDCLAYNTHDVDVVCTKRGVLSAIARMYDPLGYLSPVVFFAKLLMQITWQENLGWDDSLPTTIAEKCMAFFRSLKLLAQVNLPRCLFPETPESIMLIGFADASTVGYAAVVYLRMKYKNEFVDSRLIISKTRLAPINTLTIPRLELCAAVLLVQTLEAIKPFLNNITISNTFLFTDSSVVLAWLKLPPNSLKTFVAHRVAAITANYPIKHWSHVASENNAADLASRGATPAEFLQAETWWKGPSWLQATPTNWPINTCCNIEVIPETKESPVILVNQTNLPDVLNVENYSQFSRLTLVMAYVLRFTENLKKIIKKEPRLNGSIKLVEINEAKIKLIEMDQRRYFPLQDARWIKSLRKLDLFTDGPGILRVGGRLRNSPLEPSAKHPIILHPKSHLTKLIIDHYHRCYLHAGPNLLQSLIGKNYWIITGRRVIRNQVHKCVICHRHRAQSFTPFMSDLPPSRFEQGRAFLNVGIDFAGPFNVKESHRRKAIVNKAYICIFVCLSTKAVHIEAVSGLSTELFIAALERFIARRGLPKKLLSDHGTNFVGARNHLKDLFKWIRTTQVQQEIHDHLRNKEISWEFIPPAAPHFGGIWEAGVKSFKYHLKRVVGNLSLTHEELSTLCARIESLLNSRPLYATTSDPDGYDVLTPGHFLIGAPLLAIPEVNVSEVPDNRLNRWHLLRKFIQDVWRRWRHEYLISLQQRFKWSNKQGIIQPSSLVLLTDKNVPPLSWPMARIIETYPGPDGVVRVVKIKTASGEFVRPVCKLAPLLPVDEEEICEKI